MSKTIAIRISDDAHSALAAHCQAKGLTMTELLTPIINGLIELPPTPASPLELRVMELENQLTQHKKCLDGCAHELVALYARLDVLEDNSEHLEHCFDQDTPKLADLTQIPNVGNSDVYTPNLVLPEDSPKSHFPEHTTDQPQPEQTPEAIDLKATEVLAVPEQIGDILSPVSSRVSGEECNGTSENLDLTSSDPDIEQAIIAVLKPYPKGGYYFRSEYLGQTKILKAYRDQATQMGFVPKDLYVEGGRLTGWLNKDYCLTAV
jgi:hypothetical protein